ncbi:MAG TPA: tyrosine--tRNA ligase [Candidatus Woesearchaeota archaeon]|nr:tyrosine--tRNA ligase [Candidatus Woesearchaeota archaeon]
MTPEEKFELIKRNTQEIVTEEELKKLLKEKKQPVVYIGVAITGRPHIGYFVWVLKLADFLRAGFKVKLLLADLHGALDNTPWELLDKRYEYYSIVIPDMFEALGVDIKNFEIIKGSDFQKNKDYFFDVLRMSTYASVRDCRKASSEVVKQSDNPKLAGLIYPIMQALDEEYLGVDVQYGGLDQRKILMFAREYLPRLGYKPRVEVMTPLIPGLIGEKMSASKEESKIDLLDDDDAVRIKIRRAFCPAGVAENNGVLAFVKHVLMVIKKDKNEQLLVKRPEKFGGDIAYSDYEALEKDYVTKKLHPEDLKKAVAEEIISLLKPMKKDLDKKLRLAREAYP